MELCAKIDASFCIRNSALTPFISKSNLRAINFVNAHKQLIEYCARSENKHNSIMVFENELKVLNDLDPYQESEIIDFMTHDTSWDIIIIGKNNIMTLEPVEGRKHILRSLNSVALVTGSVYIISNRFVEKFKANNRSYIQTFVASPYIFENIVYPNPTDEYIIGQVTDIKHCSSTQKLITYKWASLSIVRADC